MHLLKRIKADINDAKRNGRTSVVERELPKESHKNHLGNSSAGVPPGILEPTIQIQGFDHGMHTNIS